MINNIEINRMHIGKGLKPMIVAEMSGNHNQSLDKALKIVEEAAKNGAHALKRIGAAIFNYQNHKE